MKRTLLIFLFLYGLSKNLHAQKCIDYPLERLIEITFNASGKMIKFPPPVIRAHDKLKFAVLVNPAFVDSQLHVFSKLLTAAKDFLNDSLTEYTDAVLDNGKMVLTSSTAYSCFLRGYDDTYKAALLNYETLFSIPFCKSDLSKIQAHQYIPAQEYVNNMLNRQFEIRVYNGTGCVDSFYLEGTCVNNCIRFSDKCRRIKSLVCEGCAYGKLEELQFQLVQHDPLNTTITQWYNDKIKDLSKSITDHKTSAAKIIADIRRIITDDNCDDPSYLARVQATMEQWFQSWLWFTGGRLTLDPFYTINSDEVKKLQPEIDKLTDSINLLKEEAKFSDSVKLLLKKKPKNIETFNRLNDSTQMFIKKLAALQKAKNKLQGRLDAGALSRKKVSVTSTVLYGGIMAVSRWGNVQVHKQFDAALNYKPIYANRWQQARITELPENETVKITFHNLDSAKQIKLEEKRLDFDDLEEFTKLAREQLSTIDLTSLTSTQLSGVKNYLGSFFTGSASAATKALDTSTVTKDSLLFEDCCQCRIIPFLIPLLADYDAGNITFPPDNRFVNPGTSITDKAFYRTELKLAAAGFEAPYRDSINFKQSIAKDTVNMGKTYIKVGKLRYFQVAAGIAFTKNPATVTTIDTAGNGFKVSTSDNRAAAIIGFKLYPLKNYNRDNSIIPRYPLRRLSVFGGFEMLHPLNNFYVGGCYDVVPGLAFTMGKNYYLETTYKIQNNTIANTSRRYKASGLYYGVTVNPVLFVQFVKLFFK